MSNITSEVPKSTTLDLFIVQNNDGTLKKFAKLTTGTVANAVVTVATTVTTIALTVLSTTVKCVQFILPHQLSSTMDKWALKPLIALTKNSTILAGKCFSRIKTNFQGAQKVAQTDLAIEKAVTKGFDSKTTQNILNFHVNGFKKEVTVEKQDTSKNQIELPQNNGKKAISDSTPIQDIELTPGSPQFKTVNLDTTKTSKIEIQVENETKPLSLLETVSNLKTPHKVALTTAATLALMTGAYFFYNYLSSDVEIPEMTCISGYENIGGQCLSEQPVDPPVNTNFLDAFNKLQTSPANATASTQSAGTFRLPLPFAGSTQATTLANSTLTDSCPAFANATASTQSAGTFHLPPPFARSTQATTLANSTLTDSCPTFANATASTQSAGTFHLPPPFAGSTQATTLANSTLTDSCPTFANATASTQSAGTFHLPPPFARSTQATTLANSTLTDSCPTFANATASTQSAGTFHLPPPFAGSTQATTLANSTLTDSCPTFANATASTQSAGTFHLPPPFARSTQATTLANSTLTDSCPTFANATASTQSAGTFHLPPPFAGSTQATTLANSTLTDSCPTFANATASPEFSKALAIPVSVYTPQPAPSATTLTAETASTQSAGTFHLPPPPFAGSTFHSFLKSLEIPKSVYTVQPAPKARRLEESAETLATWFQIKAWAGLE